MNSIYSDNLDKHPYNTTDLTSVSALLDKHFDLYPSPRYYDKVYAWTDPRAYYCRKRYVGFPKNSSRTPPIFQKPSLPALPRFSLIRGLLNILIPQSLRRRIVAVILAKIRKLMNPI